MRSVGTLFGCVNALNTCLHLCLSGTLPFCAHVMVGLVSWAEGSFPASGNTYMPCAGTLECITHSKISGAGAGGLHTPAQATTVLTGPQEDNSQGTLLRGNF